MIKAPKVRRVDYHPDAMIAGVTQEMSLFDFGVYWWVCTMIYSRGESIADDHKKIAGMFKNTHWREVRASLDRLIAMGKIDLEDLEEGVLGGVKEAASASQGGRKLYVKQCARELQAASKRIASASQNGGKGGRPSKETNDLDKAPGFEDKKLTRGAIINNQLPIISTTGNDEKNDEKVEPEKPAIITHNKPAELLTLVAEIGEKTFGGWFNPGNPTDNLNTAKKWIEAGVTPEIARPVLERIFEAKLRKNDRPRSLSYFTNALVQAVKNPEPAFELPWDGYGQRGYDPDQCVTTRTEAGWRLGFDIWKKYGEWPYQGAAHPRPDERGFWAPQGLLDEYGVIPKYPMKPPISVERMAS